jgi:hypothetical protein
VRVLVLQSIRLIGIGKTQAIASPLARLQQQRGFLGYALMIDRPNNS